MVLFIVLFAIGQVDQKKFDKLHDGLANSFGQPTVLQGSNGLLEGSAAQAAVPDDARRDRAVPAEPARRRGEGPAGADAAAQAAARRQQASMEAVRERIVAALKKQGLADAVQFQTKEQRGLVVNIVTDRVLFDLGEATLRPQGAKVLDAIAPALKDLPNEMVIEGHTDNLPISDARFASNWELSTQRATTVLRHLLTGGSPRARSPPPGTPTSARCGRTPPPQPGPEPARRHRHPVRRRGRGRVHGKPVLRRTRGAGGTGRPGGPAAPAAPAAPAVPTAPGA